MPEPCSRYIKKLYHANDTKPNANANSNGIFNKYFVDGFIFITTPIYVYVYCNIDYLYFVVQFFVKGFVFSQLLVYVKKSIKSFFICVFINDQNLRIIFFNMQFNRWLF